MKAVRAYYATKISPNISRMPNGFLLCKNVPIARTGAQEYLGRELEIEDQPDKVFRVHRQESEVFSPETLASFEGATFVDEHPSGDVTIQNVQHLTRGFVKDVRRGEGDDSDKIIADIIVTDPITIAEIEEGKREISCGYKCIYEQGEDGEFYQRDIRGNHVALVNSGRAGRDVAIKDHWQENKIPNTRKEQFKMAKLSKKTPQGILAKFLGIVTDGADPEIVGELAEQLVAAEAAEAAGEDEEPQKENEPKAADEEPAKDEEEMPAWAKALLKRFDKMEAAMNNKDEDPLEELEKEITGEEVVTVPVEEMDNDEEETEDEDGAALDEDVTDEEEAPKSEAKDRAMRKAIRDAKTVVAGIKDPKQRKTVSDSMAKLIRQSYGINPSTPKGSYAAINAVKAKKAAKARDAAMTSTVSIEKRQAAYDARNPHIKK
ncbi:MAG: DUF2213 domain-containing protein [Lacrimispora sphenoides]